MAELPGSVLDACRGRPSRRVGPGEIIITEGTLDGPLLVAVSGDFIVSRDGQVVAAVREPGAVLGEMAVLLGRSATATVVAGEGGGERRSNILISFCKKCSQLIAVGQKGQMV